MRSLARTTQTAVEPRRDTRVLVGVDDTDTLGAGGTGRLARGLAAHLAGRHAGLTELGVSRHQLLQDPRVPCTRKNRCSCIVFSAPVGTVTTIRDDARAFVASMAVPGSDPGLCVAAEEGITAEVTAFGWEVKRRLVERRSAQAVARSAHLFLEPLGGTGDGIIGALAAVGLRRGGNDGWVTQWRELRGLTGVVPVAALRNVGCEVVERESRAALSADQLVDTGGKVRPALDGGRMVLLVGRSEAGIWEALKPSG